MKVTHLDGHVNGHVNGHVKGKGHKPARKKARSDRPPRSEHVVEKGKPRRRLSPRKQPDIGTFHIRGEPDDAAAGGVDGRKKGRRGTSSDRRSRRLRSNSPTSRNDSPEVQNADDEHDLHNGRRPSDEFVGSMYQSDGTNSQPGVFTPAWAMQITRTKAELLVLSQFAFWFGVCNAPTKKGKTRTGITKRVGRCWMYKTHGQMARETHLTKHQVRGAIRSLDKLGVLIVDDDVGAGHQVFYRLDPTKIQAAVEAATSQDCVANEEDADDL